MGMLLHKYFGKINQMKTEEQNKPEAKSRSKKRKTRDGGKNEGKDN